jgi:hypothetical protein
MLAAGDGDRGELTLENSALEIVSEARMGIATSPLRLGSRERIGRRFWLQLLFVAGTRGRRGRFSARTAVITQRWQ